MSKPWPRTLMSPVRSLELRDRDVGDRLPQLIFQVSWPIRAGMHTLVSHLTQQQAIRIPVACACALAGLS